MARQRKRGIKGAGSVYKRKSDGRWTGSFKLVGMDRPKYVYAPRENNTEKVAYELLQKAMQEYKDGQLSQGKDQKLRDYMVNWFENVHRPTVSITSYARQRIDVYNHVLPVLGHVDLCKLTPQHVQQLIADKSKQMYSPKTIRGMHAILRSALETAVKWDIVPRNVCDQVVLPKVEEYESVILTKEQIIKLIEVANRHDDMGTFIKLVLMTGMRHGEILALRWADVNFETKMLSVERRVTRVNMPEMHGFVEGKPKTDAGKRQFPLPRFVLRALQDQRQREQAKQMAVGDKWEDKDLVFSNQVGGYLWQDHNLDRFRETLKEAGLPVKMRVHDLRHNVATFLINVLHYPATLVQALLGHSSIKITLGMYVDTDPEMLRPMMDDLNNLFGGTDDRLS